jgi:hypothetical protein
LALIFAFFDDETQARKPDFWEKSGLVALMLK